MSESELETSGTNQVIEPAGENGEFGEATELFHADAESVAADRVSIEQSSAGSVTADSISINQRAVRSISTQTATLTQSAAFRFTGSDTAIHDSAIGFVSSDRVDAYDSTIGVLYGPMTVAEGSPRVLFHLGPTDPSVKPVLNGQAALGLGAGIGASLVIVSRLLRRLLGN
jgi:hypothetical protein